MRDITTRAKRMKERYIYIVRVYECLYGYVESPVAS